MRIYYILGLKINLLLYRKLYILELKGRFDINTIFLYKRSKNIFRADY